MLAEDEDSDEFLAARLELEEVDNDADDLDAGAAVALLEEEEEEDTAVSLEEGGEDVDGWTPEAAAAVVPRLPRRAEGVPPPTAPRMPSGPNPIVGGSNRVRPSSTRTR